MEVKIVPEPKNKNVGIRSEQSISVKLLMKSRRRETRKYGSVREVGSILSWNKYYGTLRGNGEKR